MKDFVKKHPAFCFIILLVLAGLCRAAVNEARDAKFELSPPLVKTEQKAAAERDPAEAEREYRKDLEGRLPYVGMSEKYIHSTMLGKASDVNCKTDKNGNVTGTYYYWRENGETLYGALVKDGKVGAFLDFKLKEAFAEPTPTPTAPPKQYSSKKYGNSNYDDFDSFYDDHYDDFIDIDEAEDFFYGW